jgi:hypothetical protein
MQNAKFKMQNSKWTRFFLLLNLHFSFCTFHFSMKFSVFFQNAKLLLRNYFFLGGGVFEANSMT